MQPKKFLEPFKSPNVKPPGRTSFINRNTRPSFILPSGGNSSDEEPRQTRKTIGGERSIDEDLEDLFVRQVRKSIIQARFLKYFH